MQLNNRGWSMSEMIIYTCVLILFLFLAVYLIMSLYEGISENFNNNESNDNKVVETPDDEKTDKQEEVTIIDYEYYRNTETKLTLATYSYLNDTKPELVENKITVQLETLIEKGYIDKIYDQNENSTCSAYSKAYIDEYNDYIVSPYIKCENYTTEGY